MPSEHGERCAGSLRWAPCVARSAWRSRLTSHPRVPPDEPGSARPQPHRPRSRVMSGKISLEVLDSHLRCRTKGYLKQAGERGEPSDYESLLAEMTAQVRARATAK